MGRPSLTLTPELSRMARQELGGVSQIVVSKASGVQAYIIKQWETGKFRPPVAALERLRAYYEREGVNFDELNAHLTSNCSDRDDAQADSTAPLQEGFTRNPRPGFLIDDSLESEAVEKIMRHMGTNDDRIAELMRASFETGLLDDFDGETEARVRELFASLAENHLLFRLLQGRNIIASTGANARAAPATVGDWLSQWMHAESLAAPIFAAAGKTASKPAIA